jgi:hypothetical protein
LHERTGTTRFEGAAIMRRFTLEALTWGTVAGSITCALWLAAADATPPRAPLSPMAGLDPSGYLGQPADVLAPQPQDAAVVPTRESGSAASH